MVRIFGVLLVLALGIGAVVADKGAAGGYNTPGTGSKPTLKLSAKKKQTTRTARSKGLKVAATCNVQCAVVVQAFKGKKLLGQGKKNLAANKKTTVKVTFTKKGKKRLKKAKTLKLSLRGRATNASGINSAVVGKTVKLKRKR